IWAVVPVKDTSAAKQRLASAVPPALRQQLMLAMLEDVLAALSEASGFAGRLLVTTDPAAQRLAARYSFDWLTDGAADGHTGAVAAAARHLAGNGAGGVLAVPGQVPLIPLDIDNPADLRHFAQLGSRTRAGLWLADNMPTLASADIGRQEV